MKNVGTKKKKRSLLNLWLLSLLAFTLVVAGCSSPQSATENNEQANESDPSGNAGGEKVIFMGQVNAPVTFNPINASDVASQYNQIPIFDSLLDMIGPLEFVPKLATSFETEDNQTFVIKLNEKAAWTDGTPITADDVAFTINLAANPKTESAVGGYISLLEGLDESGKLPDGQETVPSVKVIDDKTLEIKTKTPIDANVLKEQLGVKLLILPKHVLENVPPEQLSKHEFFQHPTVTSGPFKLVKYAKDQYIEYAANPDYYRGAPKIDKLFIKLMPATNLLAQLQTGEIHMNTGVGIGLIPSADYEAVKKLENVTVKEEKKTGIQVMMFNVNTIPDAKVRQAIAYAVDRHLIVDNLLKDAGEVVDGPYSTINPYLNTNLATYEYNPEKAKALLAEAGWDSSRTLRLVVPTGNVTREQSADIIAQNLQNVGVKAKIEKYDFATVMQKGKAGEYDLLLIGNNLTLDPDGASIFYKSDGNFNYMGYSNPTVDQLFEQGKKETDPAKRKAIYDELQRIWQEDLPMLTLYSDYEVLAVSKKVKVGEPKFFGTFYNVHEWDLHE